MARGGVRLRAVPERAERALLLIRVSKEREGMIAPDLQRDATREHCARRGYDVVGAVEGIDESGSRNRSAWWPRLDAAIERVESGEVDVIVVWELSRTARNRLRWAIALDRVEAAGGRIESATEPLDETTAAGRFQRGMLAEMHAYRAEVIGEGWRATHDRRRRAGLPHNGRPRPGYLVVDRRHVPDPDTAPLVVEAYRRYIDGTSLTALAEWMNTVGLRTEFGGPWVVNSAIRVLDGGFAAGLLRVHDPDCTTRHRAGEDIGRCPARTYVPGAHEAIIDPDTWATYRRERQRRSTLSPRLARAVVPLSGVARCGSCGRRLTHSAARRSKDGHLVPARLACMAAGCPLKASALYSAVETAILAWLPEVAAGITGAVAATEPASAAAAVQAERLTRAITQAQTTLNALTLDHARRIVPTSAYEAARDELLREQRAAREELDRLAPTDNTPGEHAASAARLLEEWATAPASRLSPMLRDLCTVWVARRPGARGSDLTIYGAWDTLPTPTNPLHGRP
ncbi:MAG TPA: recombinase family protein [Cellulomonas sp.]